MVRRSSRVISDIRERKNIESYIAVATAIAFSVVSLFHETMPDQYRWSVLFAAIGLLVYRMTLSPVTVEMPSDLLGDRSEFEAHPLSARLRDARDVRVFAPSGVNLLSEQTCEHLRRTVLGRVGGSLRVVLLDPRQTAAVEIAARQLDGSLEYQFHELESALTMMRERMRRMQQWKVEGAFEYRVFAYNPGFSLVIVDPDTSHGVVIVEFHGVYNSDTSSRMHLTLTLARSERWYRYWIRQFDRIWEESKPPDPPALPPIAS